MNTLTDLEWLSVLIGDDDPLLKDEGYAFSERVGIILDSCSPPVTDEHVNQAREQAFRSLALTLPAKAITVVVTQAVYDDLVACKDRLSQITELGVNNDGENMKPLFKYPQVRQKVIFQNSLGEESQQIIVEVTKKAIRISSCNLYKFNRDGSLNKSHSRGGDIKSSIRPVDV